MQIPNALIQAVREYLECRVSEEALQPIDDRIQRELLAEMAIAYDSEQTYGEEGTEGLITDPSHTYLMSDADAKRYFPALDAAWRAAGFTDMPQGHSPYLLAHHKRIQAEMAVLDTAVAFHGQPGLSAANLHRPADRKQALDLTLKMVVPRLRRAA